MDSRQQFEESMRTKQKFEDGDFRIVSNGRYYWGTTQFAWEVWSESRESLVVALPDPFWPGYVEEDEPGLCISTNLFTIEQITEALADQGILTK